MSGNPDRTAEVPCPDTQAKDPKGNVPDSSGASEESHDYRTGEEQAATNRENDPPA